MKKKTAKQLREEAVLTHGLRLQRIFPASKWCGPVELYKRLHRIEAEAHSFAERECSEQLPEGANERKDASVLKRLDAILGFKEAGVPIFVNGDPRGYAIKIDNKIVKTLDLEIYTDWGGYGIICPEF